MYVRHCWTKTTLLTGVLHVSTVKREGALLKAWPWA